MSDLEFDILDELYFVQSFSELQKKLSLDEKELKNGLMILLQKTWIKCFEPNRENVLETETLNFEENFRSLHYLATKEGLLQHNKI
jgi:hypothetical protein